MVFFAFYFLSRVFFRKVVLKPDSCSSHLPHSSSDGIFSNTDSGPYLRVTGARGSVYNDPLLTSRFFHQLGFLTLVGEKFRLDFPKAYTVFPRIIAGGDYFFSRPKRGRLFEGGRLFQILLTRSRAQAP